MDIVKPLDTALIIGTAGHIDHGKTTLTRALTGQDTDRLPEEKARGISIDLGFAHFTLPNGQRAALIDVPGHERFVRNMVAGVHGMDAVMLVVAADEGVMPQTREHLDILHLLGVRQGLTVITKIDLVDEEMRELVREVVQEALSDSFLADRPVVMVDAVSGRGLDDLRKVLMDMAAQPRERPVHGPVRLPIDRVFTVKGFGTVVTGTLVSGTVHLEDQLEVVPLGRLARVRGLERHGEKTAEAGAGQRVAVNLAGVERDEVMRGQVLATPGSIKGSTVLVAELELLPTAGPLAMNTRVHCHVGTAEAVGRVYLYHGEELLPGGRGYAELRLDTELPAVRGDRFLVRSYSPVVTIGGGRILEVGIRHRRKEKGLTERLERLSRGSPQEMIRDALMTAGQPLTKADLARAAGLPVEFLPGELQQLDDVLHDDDRYLFWEPTWKTWVARIKERVAAYQKEHPLRVGIPRDVLRGEMAQNWPQRAFTWALEQSPDLELDREWVKIRGVVQEIPPEWQRAVETIEEMIRQGGLKPPALDTVASASGLSRQAFYDVLEYLTLMGRILRLDDTYYIARQALEEGTARVRRALTEQRTLTTSELKDVLDTNRRFTVLFLELLDSLHVTRRTGESRTLIG